MLLYYVRTFIFSCTQVDGKTLTKGLLFRTLKMRGQADIEVGFSKDEVRFCAVALLSPTAPSKFTYVKFLASIVCYQKMNDRKALLVSRSQSFSNSDFLR